MCNEKALATLFRYSVQREHTLRAGDWKLTSDRTSTKEMTQEQLCDRKEQLMENTALTLLTH